MTWGAPEFHPARKLTVHHTATDSGATDPAARVRAIYRYQAVGRGFGDIGYHYLIDEAGLVYEVATPATTATRLTTPSATSSQPPM